MTTPLHRHTCLPIDWTPAQACAALELIELLREQLWTLYGPAIQEHLRDDRQHVDPRQLRFPLGDHTPF